MTRTSSSSHSAPRRREPSGRAPTRTSRRYSPIDPSDWALRLDSALLASGDTVDLDDSRPEVPDEAPPERVGRFRIAGVLGRGGMATVYRAFDPARGDQQVALKVLRGAEPDPRRAARFEQEAALALSLDHGSFVRAFERGEDEGRPFYVMERSSRAPRSPTCSSATGRSSRRAPPRSWPRWRARWSTSTGAGSSTATSSPRTSSCTPRAGR